MVLAASANRDRSPLLIRTRLEMNGLVFSGIQPTHGIHLGNYLGAIRNWVPLQSSFDCIYCLVDLHAFTTLQDPAAMRANTREAAAALIASGDVCSCSIRVPSKIE